MRKGSEDFMLKFDKYVKENDIQLSEENSEEELNKFIKIYNEQLKQKKQGTLSLNDWEKAEDYYEIALESDDYAYCKKMLKKAIKLNPEHIDAQVELASYIEDNVKRMNEYRKLEKMALDILEKNDITIDSHKGSFYGVLETRPYIRLKYRIMLDYKDLRCYTLAIKEGEEIIQLNENDNLGARYELMALYAMLEQKEKAEELYERYEEDSVPMHLYLAALYFKFQDIKKCKEHFMRVKKLVPNAYKVFDPEKLDEEDQASMPGYYKAHSTQEIVIFMGAYKELFHDEVLELISKCW